MKNVIALAVVLLAFTTGFTCSKNSPEQSAAPATTEAPAAQDQMTATTEVPVDATATSQPTQ